MKRTRQGRPVTRINGDWTRARVITRTVNGDPRPVIGVASVDREVVVDLSIKPVMKLRYVGSKDESPLVKCVRSSEGDWIPFEVLEIIKIAPPPVELFDPPVAVNGEKILGKYRTLDSYLLAIEKELIRRALKANNGLLTRAAHTLGCSYQALGYILETRHKDLADERTAIRRRERRSYDNGASTVY